MFFEFNPCLYIINERHDYKTAPHAVRNGANSELQYDYADVTLR